MNDTIPAGYSLSVKTWENDGDNYKTVIKYGLSFTEAKFLIDICKMFISKSEGGFGNIYNGVAPNEIGRRGRELFLKSGLGPFITGFSTIEELTTL